MRVRHLAQHPDQPGRALDVLREEQGVGPADPVGGQVVAVVAPGQQPLGQRAVGDDHAVLGLGVRQQVTLGGPLDEAVLDLVAEDRAAERGLRGPPAVQRVVAHPHLADQPDPLQGPHPAHGPGVPDHRVRLVYLVQVQVAGAEPVRAGHRALFHHRGERQHREELGGQEHRVAGPRPGPGPGSARCGRTRRSRRCRRGSRPGRGRAARRRAPPGRRTNPRSPIPGNRTARCPGRSWKSAWRCGWSDSAWSKSPPRRRGPPPQGIAGRGLRPRGCFPARCSPAGLPEGCPRGPVFRCFRCRGPVGTGALAWPGGR